MTKRYFYTDPLAAAWMAKHFGMKFDHSMVEILVRAKRQYQKSSDSVDSHYVHPDSLHLLEPQKDDLVDLGKHGFAFVTERSNNNINCALLDISTGDFRDGFWHRRWHPVVKRDGILFMWPQSEESEAA